MAIQQLELLLLLTSESVLHLPVPQQMDCGGQTDQQGCHCSALLPLEHQPRPLQVYCQVQEVQQGMPGQPRVCGAETASQNASYERWLHDHCPQCRLSAGVYAAGGL